MPIKIFPKVIIAGLVLSYPLLTHWALLPSPNRLNVVLTMPPILFNAGLAWVFLRTLRAGQEPLISTFARLERRQLLNTPDTDLPADIAHYTRSLTRIWSALLIAMAVAATLLGLSGQIAWWGWFTGVISYLMIGALFLGEYAVRRLRFPHYRHANPFQLAWFLIRSGPIWLHRT